MPYLGPRSFNTTPLTSSNLAYLGDANDFQQGGSSPDKLNKVTREEEPRTNGFQTSSITDSSSNSISAFSSNIDNSSKSSNCSINTEVGSLSHRTMADLNEDDNNTVILQPCNDETHLIIPHSPLKRYNTLTVGSNEVSNSFGSINELQDLTPKIPLLRKKSGELVKSSLKLNSLTRSNSMPNTKSVRFATTLENVKFFKKSEKPTAVSNCRSSSTPRTYWNFDSSSSSSSSSSSDNDGIDNDADLECDSQYSNHSILDDYKSNFDLNDNYDDMLNDTTNQKWIIKSNDCPHNPFSLNFARLASNRNVILESVKLNSSGNSLIGFVYVHNIAFDKKIVVRLTHDYWKSFIEIENANYISSNHIFKYSDSNSNTYDKFSFIIKLDNLNIVSDEINLEFCIQYTVNNMEFWDNNDGRNYKVVLLKNYNNKSLAKLSKMNKSCRNNNVDDSKRLEIDDSSIKLKDNKNFRYEFSDSFDNYKPKTDIASLRTSNSYGLKKIKSESSLPEFKSNYTFTYNHLSNKSTSALHENKIDDSNYSLSSNRRFSNTQYSSKAVPQSASVPQNGFESNDYDSIIKKFCFFTPNYQDQHNPSSISNLSYQKSEASCF